MTRIISKMAAGVRMFVFGEDERDSSEKRKGQLFMVTPESRVRFESELKVEEDFDRAIKLLINEKEILFSDKL